MKHLKTSCGIIFLSIFAINFVIVEAKPYRLFSRSVVNSQYFAQIEEEGSRKKIQISIFYETLCPDSLRLLNQLRDIVSSGKLDNSSKSLDDLLDIQLIPYGKAATLETSGPTLKHSFICQHGPLECEGNKMHTCVIETLTSSTSKFQKQINSADFLNFLVCSMNEIVASTDTLQEPTGLDSNATNHKSVVSKSISALDSCFNQLKIPAESSQKQNESIKSEIQKCVESDVGSSLLKINGDLTSQLNPRIYFVPWVTFNGIWKKDSMEEGLMDLRKVLCQLAIQMSEENPNEKVSNKTNALKIQGCEKYYSSPESISQFKNANNRPSRSFTRFQRNTQVVLQQPLPVLPTPVVYGPVVFIPFQKRNFWKSPTTEENSGRRTTRGGKEIGESELSLVNYDRRRFIHNNEMDGPSRQHQQGWRVFGNPIPRFVTWRRIHGH